MKITIDTNADSKEEIRKIAQFLMNHVDGASPVMTNDVPTPTEGVFNLFDSATPLSTPEETPEEKPEKEAEIFNIDELIPYE